MRVRSIRGLVFRSGRRHALGIVMGVVGERYLLEAAEAARAAKRHMPIEVDITTDTAGAAYLSAIDDNPFDHVWKIERSFGTGVSVETNRLAKMHSILHSRFEKTLFIDSDVFILEPVMDIFSALDRWDFLACHAPVRYGALHRNFTATFEGERKKLLGIETELRHVFPEVNGGLLALSRSRRSRRVIERWQVFYMEQFDYYRRQHSEAPLDTDQATLRRAIIDVRPNLCILPPEYNVRVIMPYFVGGNARARILHGRGHAFDNALATINQTSTVRIGKPEIGIV